MPYFSFPPNLNLFRISDFDIRVSAALPLSHSVLGVERPPIYRTTPNAFGGWTLNFFALSPKKLAHMTSFVLPPHYGEGMNKNPILPNWQSPRRRPFTARRGIALLRAWRERIAEQPRELPEQMQFAFGRPLTRRS